MAYFYGGTSRRGDGGVDGGGIVGEISDGNGGVIVKLELEVGSVAPMC